MHLLDILYTPLISPPVPSYNYDQLLSWINKFYSKQIIQKRQDASLHTPNDIYPWSIIYAKNNGVWYEKFNEEFPQLASFFADAYNLHQSEINSVILLPVKEDYTGLGFWHRDPDSWGLRMYLENTELENSLLIKPTKLPFKPTMELPVVEPMGPWSFIQDVQYAATIPNSQQVFYINNIRAIHAVNKSIPTSKRLAVIVSTNKHFFAMPVHLKELIIKSAKHYKDSSIYWKPEK
jgi:hypothetical protein